MHLICLIYFIGQNSFVKKFSNTSMRQSHVLHICVYIVSSLFMHIHINIKLMNIKEKNIDKFEQTSL